MERAKSLCSKALACLLSAVLVAGLLPAYMSGHAWADATDDESDYEALVAGQEVTVVIDEAGAYACYSFTPTENVPYRFYTTGDLDTYAYLYDADWELIYSDDDSGDDYNAMIEQELSAGETYYVVFEFYNASDTGEFTAGVDALTDISGATVTLDADVYAHTGSEIEPVVTVTLDGVVLTEDTDYTVEYDDNVCVGTGYVYVDGCGDYGGTVTVAFTIEVDEESLEALEVGQEVTVTVGTAGDRTYYSFTPDEDGVYIFWADANLLTVIELYDADWNRIGYDAMYDAKIMESLSADTTYYVVFGFWNSWSTTGEFVAGVTSPEVLEVGQEVAVSIETAGTYAYYSFTPTENAPYRFYTTGDLDTYAYLYDADWELIDSDDDSGDDYNAMIEQELSAGETYYVAFGLYDSTATGSFTAGVDALTDISGATVTLDAEVYAYTGSDIEPEVTVTLDGVVLTEGTDYTVYYYDGLDVGTGLVEVYGKGDYAGTATATFIIMGTLVVGEEVTVYVYTMGVYKYYSFTPDADGTYRFWTDEDYSMCIYLYDADGNEIASASGYGAQLEQELSAGTSYRVAFGLSAVSTSAEYDGLAAGVDALTDISAATVTLDADTYTYTGSQIKPAVTVTLGGETLVEGTDYTVVYSNNVKVGTGSVSVVGSGNYTGAVTLTFTIEEAASDTGDSDTSDNDTGDGDAGDNDVDLGDDNSDDTGTDSDAGESDGSEGTETSDDEATGYSYSFEDVTDSTAWYYDSIYQVAELGLMTGTSSTVFGRTGNLTRAQLAVVFWRIAEPEAAAAYDADDAVSTTTTVSGIADGKYYTAAADWAVAEGVINGKEAADGSRYFDPSGTVTFQEFCAVLANYLDNDQSERDALDSSKALSGFSDAASVSSWAASSVAWCVSSGVVNGNDDGTLGPKTKIKRQRAAVMLANAVNVGALVV